MTQPEEHKHEEVQADAQSRLSALQLELEFTEQVSRAAERERAEMEQRLGRVEQQLERVREELRREHEQRLEAERSLREEREARVKAERHAGDLEAQLEALTGVSHKREEVAYSRFVVETPIQGLSLRRYLVQHQVEASFDANSRAVVARTNDKVLRNLAARWRREIRDHHRHLRGGN